MTELTKEHFDEAVKDLATQACVRVSFQKIENTVEEQFTRVLSELDPVVRTLSAEKHLSEC